MCNVALGLLDVWQERTCGGVGELSKIAEQRAAGKVTGGEGGKGESDGKD